MKIAELRELLAKATSFHGYYKLGDAAISALPALLDVVEAARAHQELHDHPNEALRMERKADSWARLRAALARLEDL